MYWILECFYFDFQPLCLIHVPKNRKGKDEVSPETLRQRRSCASVVLTRQFGSDGEDYYIWEVIRRKDREEREKLLHEMGLGGQMDEQQGLAMMIDLGATWNMMRKLRR